MREFTIYEFPNRSGLAPLTFSEAEKELDEFKRLRFRTTEPIKSDNVKDFLEKEFLNLNSKYASDDTDGVVECLEDKDRSLVDIYRLCKNYFPDCKLSEIRKTLLNIPDVYTIVCEQAKRRVFWTVNKYKLKRTAHHYHPDYRDEFGWTIGGNFEPKENE